MDDCVIDMATLEFRVNTQPSRSSRLRGEFFSILLMKLFGCGPGSAFAATFLWWRRRQTGLLFMLGIFWFWRAIS